jgi:hypothetical protein
MWQRGDSAAAVPQSGSQTARGSLQALVSSRNRSSSCTRFGVSRSCWKLLVWPFDIRCLSLANLDGCIGSLTRAAGTLYRRMHDRSCSEHVVSCTHRRTDAGVFSFGYGLSDTFSPSRRGSSIPVMPISMRSVAKSSYSTCQWPLAVSGWDFNNKRSCYLSVTVDHELRAFASWGTSF